MNEIILLKLGELVLKGLNRHTFEEKLMSNARRRLPAGSRSIPSSPSPTWSPWSRNAIWTALLRP